MECVRTSVTLLGTVMRRATKAPMMAMKATSILWTGERNIKRMTTLSKPTILYNNILLLIGFCRRSSSISKETAFACHTPGNRNRRKTTKAGKVNMHPRPQLVMNVMKLIPFLERLPAMIRFGGSPTIVMAPPMLEKIAKHTRNGTGSCLMNEQIFTVTGETRRTAVMLGKNADEMPVMPQMTRRRGKGRPLVHFAAYTALVPRTPVFPNSSTMIIIPVSKANVASSTQLMIIFISGRKP
mmetsp:Transcript_69687/g.122930  ORF Transcript_69687/g.122930 Transcript_69687/m.122930 type:complete len:240 (-) Transcript_69687:1397-2116(-)